MLDADLVAQNLRDNIDQIIADITDRMLGQNIPLVASVLRDEATALLSAMEELKDAIDSVLLGAGTLDTKELIEALNAINSASLAVPLVASERPSGDVGILFSFSDVNGLNGLNLDAGGSIGFAEGAFDLAGDVDLDITLDAEFAVTIDQTTADISFAPNAVTDEFKLTIAGEIDFDISADNALGFLDVDLTDNEPDDPNAPKDDLEIVLSMDLLDGGEDPSVSLDGRATLDFNIMAGAPDIRILPEFGANVFIEVTYSDAELADRMAADGQFAIELRDVVFKLEALAGMLQDVFGTVSRIINTFPIGEIVDLMVQRLPVVDDLAPDAFDFDEDGKITLQDVITFISILNPGETPPGFGFIQGVILLAEVIDAVDELAMGLAEDGCFDIGTLRLTREALDTIANGASFGESAQLLSSGDSDLQNLADLIAAFGAFNDFIGLDDAAAASAAPSSAPQSANTTSSDNPFDVDNVEIRFPFLESPEALANSLASLMLNGVGAPDVTLVEFDLPPLEFEVYGEVGITFFPFVGYLFGTFYAGVDFNVGYDTAGFGDTFDFTDGLFISPDLPDVTVNGETKTPVGSVSLGVGVGGGLDVVIARVSVEGGLMGTIDVFLGGTGLGDNKARLTELGGCFFNDIAGRLTAGIDLVFKFGFGIFSFEKRAGLAEVTLAQFNIDPCNPPPTEIMDELEVTNANLASDLNNGDLLLHTGLFANQRTLNDATDARFDEDGMRIGKAIDETFFVGLVPEDEDNPAGPGEVAVFAFGIFERYGDGTTALQRIVGSGGSGNDTLTVSAAINLDADLNGDIGNDILVGGGGNDSLSGGADNDQLDGDLGNDTLEGGSENDILRGGEGADSIDGGSGFDQVDFSQSDVGVTLIESASSPGLMIGIGGEAEGDRVVNVEHFIGSNHDDIFYGNVLQENIFEGNAGDDILVGGVFGDLFLGGAGADIMRGNRVGQSNTGGDATSYVFSPGSVLIDLANNIGFGADAEGDQFYGIENFQLTRLGDRFIGDSAANLVDGYDGDDELEGGAGRDTVEGGVGDDVIYALGDGDVLNGGGFLNYQPDTDELSYEKVTGGIGVQASLFDGEARLFSSATLFDDITFAQFIIYDFSGTGLNQIATLSDAADPRISSFENLTGSEFADALTGDDRDNELRGLDGNDTISGLGGDDTLIGGLGADALNGGLGRDTADYTESNAGVIANLNIGIVGVGGHAAGDTFADVENLVGSDFVDTLTGDNEDNRLDPHSNIFGGLESLFGNGGIDTAVLDYSDDFSGDTLTILLDDMGNGSLNRFPEGATQLEQQIVMTSIEELEAVTGAGADLVSSQTGGDDIVNSGGGGDFLSLGAGSDRVYAETGDDSVIRFAAETIENGLYVGAGEILRDTFILDGGRGIDGLALDISYISDDFVWLADAPDGTESTDVITLESGAIVRNFENLGGLITGSGDDVIGQFGDVDNIFSTTAGADLVTVGLGLDTADGGSSGFGFGAIFIEDVDTLVVDYSGQLGAIRHEGDLTGPDEPYDAIIRLAALGDEASTLAQVRHVNFERLLVTGTASADHIVGSDRGYVTLTFSAPGDDLDGGAGDDLIQGLAGNDTLRGGEGDDTLQGGVGNDVLIGANPGGTGDEQDLMFGGLGADRFIIGDASGLNYDGVEDVALIGDFSVAQGDVIQLTGSPSDYRLENRDPIIFANTIVFPVLVYELDIENGTERLLLQISADQELGLLTDSFEFTGNAASASASLLQASASSELEVATEITDSPELTARLWQSGVVDDATLISSFQAAQNGPAEETLELQLRSALEPLQSSSPALTEIEPILPLVSVASTITPGDIQGAAILLIDEALDEFATPIFEFDIRSIFSLVEVTGNGAATGTFTNMFGYDEGIVLSTGRVDQILGENTEDGRFVFGPRPATNQILEFEELGALEGGTLYRAEIPDIPGGLESLVLQDDNDREGGAPGFFTAFDLDALFFSNELLTTTTGLTRAELNALTRLDVIDYSAAGIEINSGTQRPGGNEADDLWGTVNGMVDFDMATLDVADWNNSANANTATGALSLGDGGSLALNFTAPVNSDPDAPTYLYLYEIGGQESVEGVVQVSPNPIGVAGDLSTDLGTPGLDGDTTTLTATFNVDFSGTGEVTPDFLPFTQVDFFDVVIVSEELPERGGAELPDLISVKVNGVDVLRDENGATVTQNTLANTPVGDFADELTLNLVGEGPLIDHLRADAFTSSYRISGPVFDGVNTIEVTVSDQADALLDTAIFIAPIEDGLPINRAPVARNDVLRLEEDEVKAINVITGDGTDTDADGDALQVVSFQQLDEFGTVVRDIIVGATITLPGGLGRIVLEENGALAFDTNGAFGDLAADESEILRFKYAVSDGTDQDSADITIIIDGTEPVNRAPIITSPRRAETPENQQLEFAVVAVDADGPDALTYSLAPGGDNDLFDLDPVTGALKFLELPDFEAPLDQGGDNIYELSVRVSDGQDTTTQTLAVLVSNVEEPCDGLVRVMGDDGSNNLELTGERECIETGDGRDQILVRDLSGTGTRALNINGDLITDFSENDVIRFVGTSLSDAEARVEGDQTIFSVKTANGSGAEFVLLGDYSDQTFILSSFSIRLAGPDVSLLTDDEDRFITTDAGTNSVFGEADDDVILTSDGSDFLAGGPGADLLLGGRGKDLLYGGLDADRMTGGADADTFAIDARDFGPGFTADFITDFTPGEDVLALSGFGIGAFEELNISDFNSGTMINLDNGRLVVLEAVDPNTLDGADFQFGDSFFSTVLSPMVVHELTDADDRFVTIDDGPNEVRAGAGSDAVLGGGGRDLLFGEVGADVLIAGAGNDLLRGGDGSDRLTGGADADAFVFVSGEETASFTADFITDFEAGLDKIVATGFGLSVDDLAFRNLPDGSLAMNLAPNHFLVFEGYKDVSDLGALSDVFDFG